MWGLAFGGQDDNEHLLIQRHDVGRQLSIVQRRRRKLVCMVNDVIEELLAGLGHGAQARIVVVDLHSQS